MQLLYDLVPMAKDVSRLAYGYLVLLGPLALVCLTVLIVGFVVKIIKKILHRTNAKTDQISPTINTI